MADPREILPVALDSSGPNSPGDDGRPRLRVYLQGGEVHATTEPTLVTTILGSCISVCLYSPATGVGGANHFLLPSGPDGSARFGEGAMRLLLQRTLALGARRGDLRAKVFGGSGTLGRRADGRTLGEQNAVLAVRVLAQEGIPLLGGDVGGERGRKLVFHTDTGDAFVLVL